MVNKISSQYVPALEKNIKIIKMADPVLFLCLLYYTYITAKVALRSVPYKLCLNDRYATSIILKILKFEIA